MLSESFVAQLLSHGFTRLSEAYLRVQSPERIERPPLQLGETGNEGMSITSSTSDSLIARLNQPAAFFAIACLSLSVVALGSFWRNNSVKVPVIVDERHDTSITEVKSEGTSSIVDHQTPLSRVSSLVLHCSEILQKVTSVSTVKQEQAVIMSTLSAELPMTIAALCQIQQLLSVYHSVTTSQQGLRTCFESILSGLAAVISTLDEELAMLPNCHCNVSKFPPTASESFKSIERVAQQLRDQRQGLLFLVDSMQRAGPEKSSGLASITLPQAPQQPSARTPGSDLKGFLEIAPDVDELPEYSPPRNGEVFSPDVKAPLSQAVAIQPDASVLKSPTTGSIADVFNAVANNEPEELDKLLADEIDPNMTSGRLQRTPLHECARLNRVSCARILFRHGAVVDVDDGQGDSPIHLASWEGNVEIGTLLVSSEADINRLSGRDGYSPLWCAISGRQIDMARLLLKHGARISLKSPSEAYPLHQAAITSQTAMCELLLERGAVVDCRDREGNTPLHYSATVGDTRTAKLLLREGADVNSKQERGLTSLHWAAHKNHPGMMKLLLDHGGDIDSTSVTFATPLHCAVAKEHIPCVKVLVRRGANLGVVTTEWDGMHGTAEDLAVRKGYLNVVGTLRDFKQHE